MLSSPAQTFSVLIVTEHSHSRDHPHASPGSPSITISQLTSGGEILPTKKIAIPVRSTSSDSDAAYSHYGHPAATRASLVFTAHEIAQANSPPSVNRPNFFHHVRHGSDIPDSPKHSQCPCSTSIADPISHEILPSLSSEETPLLGDTENHAPMGSHSGSHSHSHAGSMNMRALVLHVLGDALGNVGVIATGLIIWKTSWSFKYYFDPFISLVITLIIFSSALPLGK